MSQERGDDNTNKVRATYGENRGIQTWANERGGRSMKVRKRCPIYIAGRWTVEYYGGTQNEQGKVGRRIAGAKHDCGRCPLLQVLQRDPAEPRLLSVLFSDVLLKDLALVTSRREQDNTNRVKHSRPGFAIISKCPLSSPSCTIRTASCSGRCSLGTPRQPSVLACSAIASIHQYDGR